MFNYGKDNGCNGCQGDNLAYAFLNFGFRFWNQAQDTHL